VFTLQGSPCYDLKNSVRLNIVFHALINQIYEMEDAEFSFKSTIRCTNRGFWYAWVQRNPGASSGNRTWMHSRVIVEQNCYFSRRSNLRSHIHYIRKRNQLGISIFAYYQCSLVVWDIASHERGTKGNYRDLYL